MLTRIKDWIFDWLIRRYIKGIKVTDPIAAKNAQIDSLQRELAALKAMQAANPSLSLADQLAALNKPTPPLVTPALIEQVISPLPTLSPVPPQPLALTLPVEPTSAQALQQEPQPPAPEQPSEPNMSTSQETPVAAPSPASTSSSLPDVRFLAPILKIAMASLSVEQMIEIGLHVKMGAPGFQQFLESDIARTKFKELYAIYCDFLAGKIK